MSLSIHGIFGTKLTYANYTPNITMGGRKLKLGCLVRVRLLQELGNSLQLNIAGALVDGADFAITEHLLGDAFADEAHTAHPLDGRSGHAAGDLRRIQLRHGGVLDEVLPGLLLPGSVVDESARGGDLGIGLRELVLHALESTDELAELATVVPDVSVCR